MSTDLYSLGETYTSARATLKLVGQQVILEKIHSIIKNRHKDYIVYITGKGGIGKTRLLGELWEIYGQDESLLMQTQLIDLYHTQNHSISGLINSFLEVLPGLKKHFKGTLEEKFEETARAEQEGLPLAEVISRRKDLTDLFIQTVNKFAGGKRLVLVMDTAERLWLADDPIQDELGLSDRLPTVLDWLINQFIPQVENVIVFIAGRASSRHRLEMELEQIEKKETISIELKGLDFSETTDFLDAIAHAAKSQKETALFRWIETLNTEKRKTVYENLSDYDDNGGSLGIRPILLSLFVDDYVVRGQPFEDLYLCSSERIAERQELRSRFEEEFIRQFDRSNSRRTGDEVISLMALTPKGMDARLLGKILGISETNAQKYLMSIRSLSFIKVRASEQNTKSLPLLFLHDEMYDLLRQHNWRSGTTPILETIVDYYRTQVEDAKNQLAALYKSKNRLPDSDKVRKARASLQDAIVNLVAYELERNPVDGFHKIYFHYAEEAISAADESLDTQLRAEMLTFVSRNVIAQQGETDGLQEGEVKADSAIRWLERVIRIQSDFEKALKIAYALSEEKHYLIEMGGELVEIERKALAASAESFIRKHDSTNILRNVVTELEEIENTIKPEQDIRWAALLARTYNDLGYNLRLKGQFYAAMKAYERAIVLWRKTHINAELATTLTNLAYVEAEVGDFLTATQKAEDGLQLREKLGQQLPIIYIRNTLAHIALRQHNFEEALQYGDLAVRLAKALRGGRALGLALTARAEAYRRLANEKYYAQRRYRALCKAMDDAKEAVDIFTELNDPNSLVEALIELGCDYRELARFERGPKLKVTSKVEDLAQKSEQALTQANDFLKQGRHTPHRQIDALVNLAWLHYYILRNSAALSVLDDAEELIPNEYKIKAMQQGNSGKIGGLPVIEADVVILPYFAKLGKAHVLKGQIAFSQFEKTFQDMEALKKAVKVYTLGLEYDSLVVTSGNPQTPKPVMLSGMVHRDMARTMDRIYERMRKLNEQELKIVSVEIGNTEQEFELGESMMRLFMKKHGLIQ